MAFNVKIFLCFRKTFNPKYLAFDNIDLFKKNDSLFPKERFCFYEEIGSRILLKVGITYFILKKKFTRCKTLL